MLIIPAIDILNGNLVRLNKGVYENYKTYYEDPFEAVKLFSDHGFKRIHIVDLSGSKDGRISTLVLLKKINSETKFSTQFGGGIRNLHDVEILFNNGVDKIIIGSVSILDKPEFERIISTVGTSKIICAVDSLNGNVMIKGWREKTDLTIYDHINYCLGKDIKTFLCTDIELDGMLSGPNLKMYENLMQTFPNAQIIASGGVSNINDIIKLKSSGIFGVVIGKAIYENKIDLKELADLAR